MLNHLSLHWGRILLILSVFLVFLANAVGLIGLASGGGQPVVLGRQIALELLLVSPDFLVFALAGLLLALLLPMLNPIRASVLTFLVMLPVFYVGFTTTTPSPLIPMEYALLTILMLFGVNVLASYFSETHERQRIEAVFGQYVPPGLVARISRDPEALKLDGEARYISILFCDIKDFTSISEQLEPRQLVSLLNAVFTPLTDIMDRHMATIDKYMGDEIMAFWGAPLHDPDHANNALQAALEMQRELTRLREEFRDKGWPEVYMGMGLNTGVVSVGNMGSRHRLSYTAVGDTVNVASRLEGLTRFYDADIVVGEETVMAVPGHVFRELGSVPVKGRQRTVRVFEPLAPRSEMSEQQLEHLAGYHKALNLFRGREWEQARTLFKYLNEQEGGHPLYVLYLEYIERFETAPPGPDWVGEIRLYRPELAAA